MPLYANCIISTPVCLTEIKESEAFMTLTRPDRQGAAPVAKDQPRAQQPDAGQVFSTFVRNLEQLGKTTRTRSPKRKGRLA